MLEKTLEYQTVFLSMGRDHTITIVLLYLRGFLLKQLLLIQVLSSPSPFIAHFAISYLHHCPFHAIYLYEAHTRSQDTALTRVGYQTVTFILKGPCQQILRVLVPFIFFPTSFISILVLASSFLCRVICFDQSHSVKKKIVLNISNNYILIFQLSFLISVKT